MTSGCHKCDSLTLLLCVKPVIKVLLRCHRNKTVWQSSSRLWRNDTPPHLSRPFGDSKTRSRTSFGIVGAQQHKKVKERSIDDLLLSLQLQNKKKYQTFFKIYDAKVTVLLLS